MDISKIIAELRVERASLDEAIVSLEKLSRTLAPRRGRPPAWSRVTSVTEPHSGNGQNGSNHGAILSQHQD
jgi:hypothetical protein